MNSRFVNLAVTHMSGRVAPFSLYCINPATLFYSTGVAASWSIQEPPDPSKIRKAPLPRPAISFDRPSQNGRFGWMEFMSAGRGGDAIIAVDSVGRTTVYDAERNMVCNSMPMATRPILNPVAITVRDQLYMITASLGPQPNFFQALVHETQSPVTNWRWRYLQPPPLITSPTDDDLEMAFIPEEEDSDICAHTVVGDSQIWISTVGAGTYTFDTESETWSKAGDWVLPFRGRAEYVPEHGLWFACSRDYRQLCAFDMSSDLSAASVLAPVLAMAWDDLAWPESWVPMEIRVVPLGSRRFCIARFFYKLVDVVIEYVNGLKHQHETSSHFAVLTGVELERGGARGLGGRMVWHKSRRYVFGGNLPKAV